MRGCYTVRFTETTITAANGDVDFFALNPAADEPIEIYGLFIANKSEIGDAQEEMIRYTIRRFEGATLTAGTGGSAPTPEPLAHGDEAASFAARVVDTAVATTTGTSRILHEDTFNVRTGLQLWLPPEARPSCLGSTDSQLMVRMETTVTDDVVFTGTVYVRQLS